MRETIVQSPALMSLESFYMAVLLQLASFCTSQPLPKLTVQPSKACLAIGSDQKWYRGMITHAHPKVSSFYGLVLIICVLLYPISYNLLDCHNGYYRKIHALVYLY